VGKTAVAKAIYEHFPDRSILILEQVYNYTALTRSDTIISVEPKDIIILADIQLI
jgi:uridine kinase